MQVTWWRTIGAVTVQLVILLCVVLCAIGGLYALARVGVALGLSDSAIGSGLLLFLLLFGWGLRRLGL